MSELAFVTAEAVRRGRAAIRCKGKCREILLLHELCKRLERWCCLLYTSRRSSALNRLVELSPVLKEPRIASA